MNQMERAWDKLDRLSSLDRQHDRDADRSDEREEGEREERGPLSRAWPGSGLDRIVWGRLGLHSICPGATFYLPFLVKRHVNIDPKMNMMIVQCIGGYGHPTSPAYGDVDDAAQGQSFDGPHDGADLPKAHGVKSSVNTDKQSGSDQPE